MMPMRFVWPILAFLICLAMGDAMAAPRAALIVVDKSDRIMHLLDQHGVVIRSYRNIALGGAPEGHKTHEGDERTPEGLYYISGRNPNSQYHLALKISYPNPDDTRRARAMGKNPGGQIMIHGYPNGTGFLGTIQRGGKDWTNGCIAVTNRQMDEIWRLVPDGIPIDIRP